MHKEVNYLEVVNIGWKVDHSDPSIKKLQFQGVFSKNFTQSLRFISRKKIKLHIYGGSPSG